MRDRERAIEAVLPAVQAWGERDRRQVAEWIIDAYEALPPVITDEMVERAFALLDETVPTRSEVRAALEAALRASRGEA